LKADLVGISAMTSYVKRGYEIADRFRSKGVPVVMGGVHPSFMPGEARNLQIEQAASDGRNVHAALRSSQKNPRLPTLPAATRLVITG
jgi:hypothetical protein